MVVETATRVGLLSGRDVVSPLAPTLFPGCHPDWSEAKWRDLLLPACSGRIVPLEATAGPSTTRAEIGHCSAQDDNHRKL